MSSRPAPLDRDDALSADALAAVRRIQLRAGRVVDEVLAGQYHSSFRGIGMEFDEVRVYAPGDDVRSIDWNVTARTGVPHIKRYVEERELTVMLVVDVSASHDFGSGETSRRRITAELAALLALCATSNSDKVGLLLVADEVELCLRPKKGRRHVLRLIREVLTHEPHGTRTHLADGVGYATRALRRHAAVFVLSDFLVPRDEEDRLVRELELARRRHDVVAFRLTDPLEHELPDLGLVEWRDLESGATRLLDTGSRRVREAFATAAAERERRLEQRLRRAGVDHVGLTLTPGWVDDVVRYFARRSARSARGRRRTR